MKRRESAIRQGGLGDGEGAISTAPFATAASNVKAGCPVSRVFYATITMDAKLVVP